MRIHLREELDEMKKLETYKTVEQLKECEYLTEEEQIQLNRAISIPEEVRAICTDRIKALTEGVMEMEAERDVLCDFLNGVVADGE